MSMRGALKNKQTQIYKYAHTRTQMHKPTELHTHTQSQWCGSGGSIIKACVTEKKARGSSCYS